MKKLYTYLSIGILFLTSFTTSSQVLIDQDFDSSSILPPGWNSGSPSPFVYLSIYSCDGARSARVAINSNYTSPILNYLSQQATGEDIVISFEYKILQQSTGNPATTENFGSFILEYTANGGATWTPYFTIDMTTHTPSTSCATLSHTISGVNVPAGSSFGWRLRGVFIQGNNHIYIDNFRAVEQVDCIRPFNISVGNVAFNSIEISWQDINNPAVTEWNVAYCPVGTDPTNSSCFLNNIDTSNSNPYTITGLVESTDYDIYIRAVCGPGVESIWTGPITIQTDVDCSDIEVNSDPLNPAAADLPFTHSSNTSIYGNNFSGFPGSLCNAYGTYLSGNDVVYKYIPDNDYILTVELSGLSDTYSGVFIYNNCKDIGDKCLAPGSTNETTAPHSFQVAVEEGKGYFIVVTSKNPTMSMDYTLTINSTPCANYSPPVGSTTQNFINNQTLAELDVTGPNLSWYSDSAATLELPDDTLLINNTTYYVTQSFQVCEGPPLAVTVTEVACTGLDTVSFSGSAVCGKGSVKLMAQGVEPAVNTHIYWYESAIGGNKIGVGSTWYTPVLEQTTSFWASEVAIAGQIVTGQALANSTASVLTTANDFGLFFKLTDTITLIDVEVVNASLHWGVLRIELKDVNNSNTIIASANVMIPGGGTPAAPVPFTVKLDFEIPPGYYRLLKAYGPNISFVSAGNSSFPYSIGTSGEVISGSGPSTTNLSYYYFFNWTIFEHSVICESTPRQEVVATVNEVADVIVSEPLPYVHTANTSTYGNNYHGTAGWDCGGTGDLLNGNDVVYQFSPTVGGVYSVQLSNLSSDNATVFVYESCYDIGVECHAGAMSNGTTSNFGIDEVAMYSGYDYFIVVSTSDSTSTDYTLTINTAVVSCIDYNAAPEGDETQYFGFGDTLADLYVKGGSLTWYSDAAGTNPIPDTTVLIDGTTYYVSHTLNVCTSDLLAITVIRIFCADQFIVSATDGTTICNGSTQLQALGNVNVGTEVYWYDSPIGGNLVGVGSIFTTPRLTSTTSYWAAEVFIVGAAPLSGQGKVTPALNLYPSIANMGLEFDVFQDFTLKSVDVYPHFIAFGTLEISLFDNTGMRLQSNQYTVSPGGGPLTVPLNFDLKPGTGYRLLPTSMPRFGMWRDNNEYNYPYDIGVGGALGSITKGISGLTNFVNNNYNYFYNWTVGGREICESERYEVIATVNQEGDILIPPSLPYIDSNNNTSNYGNTFTGSPGTNCVTTANYLYGDDVLYVFTPTTDGYIDIMLSDLTEFYAGMFVYESCGDVINKCVAGVAGLQNTYDLSIKEFFVTADTTYYIVISSMIASSIGYTLEIKGFVCADFPTPIGNSSQEFILGETLGDLKVDGTTPSSTLIWYSDAAGQNEIPETTPLVDKTTYYVRQNFNDCDSPLLAIRVSKKVVLGVIDDVVFADLKYYPNPVENKLIITNSVPIDTVEVYSLLGQKLSHQQVGIDTTTVDMNFLATGVYLLKVTSENKVGFYHIIKK